MVKVKIVIDDNGVKTDLDGFKGDECIHFMDRVEASVANDHGLALKDKQITRKAPTTNVSTSTRINEGGA